MAPLTDDGRTAVFFTESSHQILSNCVYLLGVSVLSYCLAHRLPALTNWKQWSNLTWGRLCVMLVLVDSWLFIFFTGVLVNGVGLSYSKVTCALAIYACISFYGLSKVLIYGFLTERVYIVWSGGNRTPRFSTPAYRICSVVLLGYVAVLILMVHGENSTIRQDGLCLIGLKNYATIPLISYDLFLNGFLTTMFLWPLYRSSMMSHNLRRVATRTLYGAIASLLISATNIAILTSLKGEEYGWACLGSCVTDVALNAIALSWVTAGSYSSNDAIVRDRFSLPTMDIGPLTLAQSEQGKESDYRGSTLLATVNEAHLPESYYDYIPRDQVTVTASPTAPSKKHWFWGIMPSKRKGESLASRKSIHRNSARRTSVAGAVIEESSLPTRPVSRSVSLPQSPRQTNTNFIIEEEDSQSGLEDREGGDGDAAERLGSPVAPIQIHVSQHVQLSVE